MDVLAPVLAGFITGEQQRTENAAHTLVTT
jgi:hypothetical protein